MGNLTDTAIRGDMVPGKYGDGDGLWLFVSPTGAKRFVFRFKIDGRENSIALGPYPALALAKARLEAAKRRSELAEGKDPAKLRKERRAQGRLDAALAKTFEQTAQELITSREGRWKNEKHAAQWSSTLATYVYPIIGALPVSTIDKDYVLDVLNQPLEADMAADGRELRPAGSLWETRPETANRVRGRIEAVLDWASFKEYRQGENPARWRGNLDFALHKASSANHHAALPYDQIASFVRELRGRNGISALALEFLILTAARTSEVLDATWGELDENCTVWTVPAERMKAGKEHRVPLAPAARAILAKAATLKRGDYVFPAGDAKRPMSNMALLALLRRMERTDITVHGFRSAFRDFVAEQTSVPNEVAEMALAHTIPNKVEAAYRRSDLFEKRRALMDAWANYCNGVEGATLHQIPGRAA
jgi:integrase